MIFSFIHFHLKGFFFPNSMTIAVCQTILGIDSIRFQLFYLLLLLFSIRTLMARVQGIIIKTKKKIRLLSIMVIWVEKN